MKVSKTITISGETCTLLKEYVPFGDQSKFIESSIVKNFSSQINGIKKSIDAKPPSERARLEREYLQYLERVKAAFEAIKVQEPFWIKTQDCNECLQFLSDNSTEKR